MLGKQLTQAAAGSAAGEGLYVDDVFSTYVYEGSGATRNITNDIDLAGEGGLVWIKRRDGTHGHKLTDTERGATKALESYDTTVEVTDSNGVTAFNSDGFSLGTTAHYNGSTLEMCSWTFRKAPGFFDVVTYTGNDAASQSVAHNLGSVPGMVVVKDLGTNSCYVYHRSEGAGKYGVLNSTAAFASSTVIWGNTTPTSTHFYVGSSGGGTAVNGNGRTYVAYIFAHDDQSFGTDSDESIIKCGSYTGNGSATGPVINVGFEPQWLLIKRTGSSGNWLIFDAMRGIPTGGSPQGNPQVLYANGSDAEQDASWLKVDLLPTGFQLKTFGDDSNANGSDYIYIAIRRPHKPPEAGTDVFAVQDGRTASDGNTNTYTSGFPVDLVIRQSKNADSVRSVVYDRLRGGKYFLTHGDAAEVSSTAMQFDSSTGIRRSAVGSTNVLFAHMFRRAPGFFDIVTYDGTGSTKTESHNLGVAPELMFVKRRSGAVNWAVYYGDNTDYLILNSNSASIDNHELWNDTSPTASVFTVGPDNDVNAVNNTYIAYLFATLSGISKVGTYTGTGSNINVDCGFTAGARFVLIKRTDSTGDWYVWDTARGIVAGDDPWTALNSTGAQVTSNDFIDPYTSGFTVTSTAPAGLNASGGTYLFLAIA